MIERFTTLCTTLGFPKKAIDDFANSHKNDIERFSSLFNVEKMTTQIWEQLKTRWDNWLLWSLMAWAATNQRFTFMASAALTLALSPASDTVNSGVALLKSLDEKWDKFPLVGKVLSYIPIIGLNYAPVPVVSMVAQKCFSVMTGAATGLLFYNLLKERIIDQAEARKEIQRTK